MMTSDAPGKTDAGVLVPAGTEVRYLAHLPGGMVRVKLPDGTVAVMHPACFPALREE
jgi:hypothetical protein